MQNEMCPWWLAEIPGLWFRQEAGAPSAERFLSFLATVLVLDSIHPGVVDVECLQECWVPALGKVGGCESALSI